MAVGSAVAASGQTTTEPRWTFGGTVGLGKTWEDEGGMGSGWLLGAYATRRLSRRVDLELAADVQRHDRSAAGEAQWESKGQTTYLSLAAVRHYGDRRSSWFILGGGTIGIHRGTAGFADEPPVPRNDSTHGGLIVGTGLSFRTRRQVEISPALRMTLMGVDRDGEPVTSIMTSIRVGWGL